MKFKWRRERLAHERKEHHPGYQRPPANTNQARQKAFQEKKAMKKALEEEKKEPPCEQETSPEPPKPPKKRYNNTYATATWSAHGYVEYKKTCGVDITWNPYTKKYYDREHREYARYE